MPINAAPPPDVLIIGAGLAGLACALSLQSHGVSVSIIDASERVGGRIVTDAHDGFLFDRGFQVLQTAYPEAQAQLDYRALDLRPFQVGALIRHGGRFYRIADPWREPGRAFAMLFSPIGSFKDKLLTALLRHRALTGSLENLYRRPETSTLHYLRECGFSDAMLERFLRPFLAGVFFDGELETSSRACEFVLRAFATGATALPARGMGAIPHQLASRLPEGSIRLNTRVERLDERAVMLANGERLNAKAIVLAVDKGEAARLLGEPIPVAKATTCLYFAAAQAPITEPILVLNGEGAGPINSLCVPSQLSADYAPPDQALVCVNVLGNPSAKDAELAAAVRAQLIDWFGSGVETWQYLRTYRIPRALPLQTPPVPYPPNRSPQLRSWLFAAGERVSTVSIHWALDSGRRAGEAVAVALG